VAWRGVRGVWVLWCGGDGQQATGRRCRRSCTHRPATAAPPRARRGGGRRHHPVAARPPAARPPARPARPPVGAGAPWPMALHAACPRLGRGGRGRRCKGRRAGAPLCTPPPIALGVRRVHAPATSPRVPPPPPAGGACATARHCAGRAPHYGGCHNAAADKRGVGDRGRDSRLHHRCWRQPQQPFCSASVAEQTASDLFGVRRWISVFSAGPCSTCESRTVSGALKLGPTGEKACEYKLQTNVGKS